MPNRGSLLLIVAALGMWAYGAEHRTELPLGGKWITAQSGQGNYRPALRFFKEFVVERDVRRATLKATALGLYVPFVNGKEITDRRLMPGWTQYEYRVPSQTFDVTRQIVPGTNVLAALVGDGWYCGQISYVGQFDHSNACSASGAFSIVYGIAPDDVARRATVGLLKELIAERDGHLATGFGGRRFFCARSRRRERLSRHTGCWRRRPAPAGFIPSRKTRRPSGSGGMPRSTASTRRIG